MNKKYLAGLFLLFFVPGIVVLLVSACLGQIAWKVLAAAIPILMLLAAGGAWLCGRLLLSPAEKLEKELRSLLPDGEGTWGAPGFLQSAFRRVQYIEEQVRGYRAALAAGGTTTLEIDLTNDCFLYGQEELASLYGLPPFDSYSEAIASIAGNAVVPDDAAAFSLRFSRGYLMEVCSQAPGSVIALEYRRKGEDGGEPRWVSLRMFPLKIGSDDTVYALGFLRNIDQKKRRYLDLVHKAERDSLTNLYNKGTAEQEINRILLAAPGKLHALMVVDLDGFKQINDNLGHLQGDCILREVSGKLQSLFRSSDVVGRVGGDEFVVFLSDCGSRELAYQKAEEICNACCGRRCEEDRCFDLSASVGIAFSPDCGLTYASLFQSADAALYQSKQNGKNRYTIYWKK